MSVTTYTWNGTTWTNGTPTGTNDTMYVMAGTSLGSLGILAGATLLGNTVTVGQTATVVFTSDTLESNTVTLGTGDTVTFQGSATTNANGTIVTGSTILADTYNFGSNDVINLIDTQVAGPLDANGNQTAGTTLNFQNGDTLNLVSSLPGATSFDMLGHGGGPVTGSRLSLSAASASLLITATGTVFDGAMNFFTASGGTTTLDVLQNGTGTATSLLQLQGALVESGGTLVVENTGTGSEFANAGFLLVSGDTASALVQLNAVMDAHAGEMNILGGAHGATIEVNTAIGGGQAIVFDDANGTLRIDAVNKLAYNGSTPVAANFKAQVEGFQAGDTILLAGVAPSSTKQFSWSYGTDTTYGPDVLELFKISNGTTALAGVVRLAGSAFAPSSGTLTTSGPASNGNFVFTTVGTNVAITVTGATAADWLGGSGSWSSTNWSTGAAPTSGQMAEIAMTTTEATGVLAGSFTPAVVTVTGSQSATSLVLADPLATLAVSGTLALASSLQQTEGVVDILSGGTLSAASYRQVGNDFVLATGGTLNLVGQLPFSTGLGTIALDLESGGTIDGALHSNGATFIGNQSGAYVQVGTGAAVTDTYTMIGGGNYANSGNEQASLNISGSLVVWNDAGGDSSTPYSGAMLIGGGLTGVQNTLNASGQFPTVVNPGGNGNLWVDNFATLTDATYAILGVTTGSSGSANVTGGAVWSIHPSATVTVPGSIVVGTTTLYAANNAGQELPALMVGGQGNGNLYIGNNGSLVSSGTVLVGAVDAPSSFTMVIGTGTGAAGSVVVDGPNALLNTEGGVLSIGNKGAGTLSVNNGGTVLTGIQNAGSTGIAFGTVVGNKSGGNGQLNIIGNGNATSLFEVQSGDLVIGRDGVGSATVNSYGSLAVASGTIWLGGINATTPGVGGGQLNVNDGTVQASGLAVVYAGGIGTGSQFFVNGGLISLADALNLDSGSSTIGGSTIGSGVVLLGSNGTATIGGHSSLTINGSGTLLLAAGYSGSNLLGRLTLGDANGGGQIFVAGGTILDAGGILLGMTLTGGTPTPTNGTATLQLSGNSFVQAGGMGIAPASVVTVDASSTLLLGSTGFGAGAGVLIGTDGTLIGDGFVDTASNIVDSGTIIAYTGGTLQLTGLAVTGTGTLALDAGGALNLSAGVTGTNIIFGTGTAETLALADPSAFNATTVAGFGVGDTIDLQGQVANNATFAQTSGTAGLLNIYSGTTLLESYTLSGTYTTSQFLLQTDAAGTGTSVIGEAPCFAEGTRIATARGEIAVERLEVGEAVRLARGGSAEVVWLGHRTVDCAHHPRPHDVLPVRVLAHAFGAGQPRHDLVLSPDHAVFVDGVLIPIRYLVNDATILQQRVERVTYWHVELAQHDVLLAENLPAESHLDTGNRGAFENGEGPTMLHPDFALRVWDREACARLVLEGAELEAARSWLLARAERLGHTQTAEADLRILADGVELAPQVNGREFWVALPDGARSVRLVSRSAVPAHVRDNANDCRRLGVAIAALALDDEPVAPADARLARGWHEVEDAASWRWTDGDAEILACGGGVLTFTVAMTARYWEEKQAESARVA